jgi:outer membrane receptor protein involved in Fe transport
VKAAITDTLTGDIGIRWSRDTLVDGDDDTFDPRVALLWRIGSDTELRFAAGRFSQFQTLDELQLNDGVTTYHPAQAASHLVGSLRHRIRPGLTLRAEVYRKRYSDLYPRFENLLNAFVILPELKPDRVRIDARDATARGAELSLQAGDDGPLEWWLTYAWGDARDETAAGATRRSWDQSHALGAGLAWSDARWDFSVAATYHTGWPTTSVHLVATEPLPLATTGPRNGERFDDYASIDLRVARRFPLETGLLTVYFEVTNLTNRDNPCCTEYEFNTDEDVPFLETEVNDNLPLLPNLGVTWEF